MEKARGVPHAIRQKAGMIPPAPMFCCGCPLEIGVPTIMGFHLFYCVVYVSITFSNVVLHSGTVTSNLSLLTQIWVAGFNLCGIPIIICGLYGVVKRVESCVRAYLYYLMISSLDDIVYLISIFAMGRVCDVTRGFINVLALDFGKAFMCGVMRVATLIFTVAFISMEVYCIYIVWSFCKDVHLGTNGPGLQQLIISKEEMFKKRHAENHAKKTGHSDIVGVAHSKLPSPYPNPSGLLGTATPLQAFHKQFSPWALQYGALEGVLPHNTIFGGTEHDTSYPPLSKADAKV